MMNGVDVGFGSGVDDGGISEGFWVATTVLVKVGSIENVAVGSGDILVGTSGGGAEGMASTFSSPAQLTHMNKANMMTPLNMRGIWFIA